MLFIPGPVELTEEINLAQIKHMINHRGSEYRDLHTVIISDLCNIFSSDTAFIITASGTGGIEAALASLISKEDRVICLINGTFGKRLAEATKIYSDTVIEHKIEYGKGFNLERVKEIIDSSNAKIFTMVYNDTSTGVVNNAGEICKYAKQNGLYTIVDGISAIGGHPMDMNEWGIDICVTGSQKCIGAPPGLSFIGIMNSALEKIEKNDVRSYYFDLRKYKKYQEKNETPFTPAVNTLFSVRAALDELFKEGIEKRIERHRKTAEYMRKGLEEIGFELFAEKGFESNTVTSFKTENADFIKSELKAKYGIEIAGGMEELKGKILRIGHLGNFKENDVQKLMSALKESGAKK